MTFSNIIISGVCSNAVPRISLHSASVKVNQGPEVELSFTVSIMYSGGDSSYSRLFEY